MQGAREGELRRGGPERGVEQKGNGEEKGEQNVFELLPGGAGGHWAAAVHSEVG